MSNWGTNTNSNRIKDTYVKGFLDVSGGSITVNKSSTLRVMSADTNDAVIEFKPEYFTINAGSTFDISYSTLASLGALGVSFETSSEFIAGKVKFITSYDSATDISINLTNIGTDLNNCRLEVYGPIHGQYGMLVDGDISFNDKLYVKGDSSLGGNLFVTKSAQFYNDVSINGNLYVDKDLSLNGNLYVTNNAFFNSNTRFSNPVSIQKDISSAFALDVSGITMLRNNLYVGSDVSFGGKLFVNSDVSFNSKLFVNSDASFNQKLIVGNDVSFNSKLFVRGTSNLMGDVSMNSKLIVGSDVSFNSKLFVSSDVSFNSKLIVGNDVSFNSKLFVRGTSSLMGDVSLNGNLQIVNKVGMGTVPSATYELDVLGQVRIQETVGSLASATTGSLVLEHADASGVSSIVFTSKNNSGNDYAYIQYQENVGGTSEKGLLTIGIENESGSDNTADRISLFSSGGSGFVGINTKNPLYHLDVSGITRLSNNLYVSSDVSLNSKLFVNSTSNLVGDVSMNSKLIVGSDVSFNSKLFVNRTSNLVGDVSMNSKLIVGSDVSFNSKLFVGTTSNLVGDVSMNSKLIVGSDVSFNGKLFVNTTSNLVGDVSMNSKLIVGSDVSFNSKLFVNGQVRIQETVGSVASASTGSLVLQHADASGASSIVFTSKNDPNTDYAYIQYQENVGGPSEKGLLTIGIENNFGGGGGNSTDRISLFCASGNGFVGINTKDPLYHLDVSGITSVSSNLYVGSDVSFNSKLIVGNDVSFNSKLFVGADASFNSKLIVGNDVSFNSKLFVRLDASFNQKLFVGSDASFNSKLFVGADASFNSNLYVGSDLSVNGNLYVTKRAAFASDVSINGTTRIFNSVSINKDISSAFALDVSGQIRVYEGGAGTVASSSGGSLTLEHGLAGGTSSLVFKTSNSSTTADYAYIQYTNNTNIIPYKWDFSFNSPSFVNGVITYPSTGIYNTPITTGPPDASFAWATIASTPSQGTRPSFTHCISFNQTNITTGDTVTRLNYAATANPILNFKNFSYSAWICPTLVSCANNYIIIASGSDGVNIAFEIAINGDNSTLVFVFGRSTGISNKISSSALVENTWYNIVCTYNDFTKLASIYINGSLTSSGTISGITEMNYYNLLHIGCRYGSAQGEPSIGSNNCKAFKGYMTFINMFNAVLPATDVSSAFNTQNYVSSNAGLLTIGNENDINYINNDRIALWPGSGAGFVGVNTQIPQYTLDISGSLNTNSDSTVGGNLFVTNNISTNSNLFVGSDVSFNQKLFVNSDVSINGMVSTGNLFVNGVQITSGGGNLSGNVQVGSNNGFVSIDKPYFYADPSLTIYYNFDTSFNTGTQIRNIANPGTYDGSINGTTTGMIDTTTKLFGTASLKNNPNINNNGIVICLNSLPTTFSVNSSMSFSFWVYKQNAPATSTFDRIFEISDLIISGSNDNNAIALDISSSGIILPVLTYGGGPSSCINTISSPILSYNVCNGIWNHIIWNITPSNSYIYINGSLKQTDTINNAVPTTPRKSASVGYSLNSVGTRDFSGNIDDFRYYNGKALNYAEIYQLYNNNFYTLDICGGFLANGSSVIYETVGSKASANTGSLTLLHGDASGSSSIMFKSVNDPLEYGYIQFEENSGGSTGYHYGLMTLGIENDAGPGSYTAQADRISLFPSGGTGYVGVNTKTPQSTLDVSGQMRIYEGAGTVASASTGSLVLEHAAAGGTSSIVFKASNSSSTADYAYIQYTDSSYGTYNSYKTPTYKWDLSSNVPSFSSIPSTGTNTTTPLVADPVDASLSWITNTFFNGTQYSAYFNQRNMGPFSNNRTSNLDASVNTLSSLTFSCWINPTNSTITNNYICIASFGSSSTYSIELSVDGNGQSLVLFFNSNDSNKFNTYYRLTDNIWYHVAFTYSPGAANLYLNGILQNGVIIGTIPATMPAFTNLYLGSRFGTTENINPKGFQGYMSYVNVFNTALNAADIFELYQNPQYIPTANKGLMTIGIENDINYTNSDSIALWPGAGTGCVGINTKYPRSTLDVNGSATISSATINSATIGSLFVQDAEITFINGITVGKGGTNVDSNTALGFKALDYNTTGTQNVAVGYEALLSNTDANFNTAVGFYALRNNSGSQNTAIGNGALLNNTTGALNVSIGSGSLIANTTGGSNTAIGSAALNKNISGYDNTAIGLSALLNNSSGYQNISIGVNSLYKNTTGYKNIAIGNGALYDNSLGYQNTAVGFEALNRNSTGYENVAVGEAALYSDISGYRNIAVGFQALKTNSFGYENSAFGRNALYNINTGIANVAVGNQALENITTQELNTAIGFAAGRADQNQSFYGNNNTYVGAKTYQTGAGSNNTYIGMGACQTTTDVWSNSTAIGYGAQITASNQIKLGTTSEKVIVGGDKLELFQYLGNGHVRSVGNTVLKLGVNSNDYLNVSSTEIVAAVDAKINGLTIGKGPGGLANNTAIGFEALKSNTTGGNSNTAVGYQALYALTDKWRNVAVGNLAGSGTFQGDSNTFLGYNAKLDNNWSNSTAIGVDAVITASNQIKLGTVNEHVIVGVGLRLNTDATNGGVQSVGTTLYLGANSTNYIGITSAGIQLGAANSYSGSGIVTATSFNATSDYRFKENIMPLDRTFTVDVLNPVIYNLKDSIKQDIGFIAHEVQEFYPFLVTGEKDGSNNQSLNYNGFIGILTKEIKDLKVKVLAQEEKISNQEDKISAQEDKISAQEDKISAQEDKALKQEDKISNQDTRIQILEKMMSDLINK